MAEKINNRTQKLIETLLDWRSPYEVNADIVDYIEKQSDTLRKKINQRRGFADRYAEKCGELPATMLDKVEGAKNLLKRWRDARDNGTLDQETLSRKDLSVTSDCLQFVMLPFTRYSQSASEALGSGMGAVAALFTGGNPAEAANLAKKADDMTQEQKVLCRMLQAICRSSGYTTGVKLPQRFEVDNSWRR